MGHFIGEVKAEVPHLSNLISGSWCILMERAIEVLLIKEQRMESLAWCLAHMPLALVTPYQRHRTEAGDFFTSKQHPFEKIVGQG